LIELKKEIFAKGELFSRTNFLYHDNL